MSTKSTETQARIIKAAREIFLNKGFSGTSMSQIATKAEVTKPLLFHYFKTKEDLWQNVKDNILGHITLDEFTIPTDSLENFLKAVINLRFNLYRKNPDLVLIMKWQRLESQNIEIKGTTILPVNLWTEILTNFQKHKIIGSSVNIDLFQSMIFSLTSLPFLENWEWVKSEEKVNAYKEMIFITLLNLSK